ncbi:hypothetical protein X948_4823 [Burkholderia pseudomallei MSHR5608]|nr:hypothetical protein X948_4823 [Burkholderia pseudomallei MSHR5608]
MIAARGATAARRSRFVGARAAAPRGGDLSRGGVLRPACGAAGVAASVRQALPDRLASSRPSSVERGTGLCLWLGSMRCDAQRNATQRNSRRCSPAQYDPGRPRRLHFRRRHGPRHRVRVRYRRTRGGPPRRAAPHPLQRLPPARGPLRSPACLRNPIFVYARGHAISLFVGLSCPN